jgi:hypothetical protein
MPTTVVLSSSIRAGLRSRGSWRRGDRYAIRDDAARSPSDACLLRKSMASPASRFPASPRGRSDLGLSSARQCALPMSMTSFTSFSATLDQPRSGRDLRSWPPEIPKGQDACSNTSHTSGRASDEATTRSRLSAHEAPLSGHARTSSGSHCPRIREPVRCLLKDVRVDVLRLSAIPSTVRADG